MAVLIAFIAGISLSHSFNYFPLTSIVITLAGILVIFKKKPFKKNLYIVLFLLLGFLFAFLRRDPSDNLNLPPQGITLRGVFKSLPVKNEYGFQQDFYALSPYYLKGKTMVLYSDAEFIPGTFAVIDANVKKSPPRRNPGFMTGDRYTGSIRHIYSLTDSNSFRWHNQRLRYRLSDYFNKRFRNDVGGFLQAITIGYRGSLSDEVKENFRKTGISHILSISGTHFGLLSLLVFSLFRFLIHSLPYKILNRLTIHMTPSEMAALLTLPFIIMYLLLSGMRIPTIRSFIMINLFLWGLLLGRRGVWLNSLILAAFIVLFFQPDALLSISFHLSFIAVLFIGLSIERYDKWNITDDSETFRERKSILFIIFRKIYSYIRKSFIITVSAFLGTLPIVIYQFHSISIISPLANLTVVPLICFVILPLVSLGSFVFLITGSFPFEWLISGLTGYLFEIVGFLKDIPYSSINIRAFPAVFLVLMYISLFSFFVRKKDGIQDIGEETDKSSKKNFLVLNRKPILITAITAISLICFYLLTNSNEFKVTFLDTGQGDAAVIEMSDDNSLVIDTGKTGKEIASFLRYRGMNDIDAVILSHAATDHSGGLPYLFRTFRIRNIWDNGRIAYSDSFMRTIKESGTNMRHLSRGDKVEFKDTSLMILHPYKGFYTLYGDASTSINNDSMVLRINGRKSSYLFTGDIEEEAEEDIINLGGFIYTDILKVAHHGSKTSSIGSFINIVNPKFAVISAGKWNSYGHPHTGVLERLDRVKVYRTDNDGAISFTETEDGIKVKRFSDFQIQKADSLKTELMNVTKLFITW